MFDRRPFGAWWRPVRVTMLALCVLAMALLTACGEGATERAGEGSLTCDLEDTGPGVTETEIHLGATMPLSGSAATGGSGVKAGQDAYYAKLNEAGGIKGRQIKLTVLDDAYDPSRARKQMRQLVEGDKVFAVSGGYGAPFFGVVRYLEGQGVPAIAPYAPNAELGTMENPHIFMAAVNYIQEFQIVTEHVMRTDPPKKIVLVGVAGDVGEDAKKGVEQAIAGTDIDFTYIAETPGTTDFTPIASQLKNSDADWVFLLITPADTGGLLKAMKRIGYTPKTASWQGMTDESYLKEFGSVSQDMLVALEFQPLDGDEPATQQFVKEFTAETGKAPTQFNAIGWAQAQVTAHALEEARGLSRGCVVDALEGISGYETGIYPPVTWGKDDRAGVDAVGIGRIKGNQLELVEEFKSVQE